MAKSFAFLPLLLLLLLVAAEASDRQSECTRGECRRRREQQRGDRGRRGDRRAFEDLKSERPQEIFRSEAGRIEEWDPNSFSALCDADLGARRLILERNGLALPCYTDAPVMKVITRGSARVGIINPLTDKVVERSTVFHVRKGDVIALPRGTACWIYNEGDERTEVLEVADTTYSSECGRFKVFLLAGGKQEDFGSVLHGFSRDILAHAFDVDEQTVDQMREVQGAAIIRVDERRRMQIPETNTHFVDFVYRWSQAEPDVRVRDAGELRLLNSYKLPILKTLNMGGACLRMEPGALTAPGWIHNAHKVMYVYSGNGKVEAARENGEKALNEEVQEGSLVIIPANYPSAKLAGNRGLHYISIFTNDRPIESYIAGRNSVYQGMPSQIVSSGLQIDEKTQQQIADARRDEAYLFPPRKRQHRGREPSFLETLVGAI